MRALVGRRQVALLLCGVLLVIALSAARCSNVRLVLRSEKTEYLVDEPLQLTVAVRNDGDTDLVIPVILDLNSRYLSLCQVRQGERPVYYDPGVHVDRAVPTSGVTLGPGEAYSTRVWLAASPLTSQSLCATPGRFTLFARYALPKDFPGGAVALRSSDIRITVVAPVGEERLAHSLLTANGAEAMPWRYPTSPAGMNARMKRLAALAAQYPQSAYAPYAVAIHAADLYGMATLPNATVTEDERAQYLDQSLQQYRRFAELAANTPLEAQALSYLGRELARLGEVDHAAKAFEAALTCPTATTEERLETLCWMRLMEWGVFREHQREADAHHPRERFYPLAPLARALGFTVEWDGHSQTATITGPRVRATMQVGSPGIRVNGNFCPASAAVMAADGEVCVPVLLLGHLLIAQYGEPLRYLVRDVLP